MADRVRIERLRLTAPAGCDPRDFARQVAAHLSRTLAQDVAVGAVPEVRVRLDAAAAADPARVAQAVAAQVRKAPR
jgi:hypothetical protein